MIVLDENIPESQRLLLRSWRIQPQQIGHEIGRRGMKDDEIIPLLHKLHRATFFTRDLGFYKRDLCHPNYCLVILDIGQYETASFIKRVLQSKKFNTKTKRMGRVIKVTHIGIKLWSADAEKEDVSKWELK